MGQVLKFTGDTTRALENESSDLLIGYAAAACDIWRGGEDVTEVIKECGITLDGFKAAGVEEYDLETLVEIYKHVN